LIREILIALSGYTAAILRSDVLLRGSLFVVFVVRLTAEWRTAGGSIGWYRKEIEVKPEDEGKRGLCRARTTSGEVRVKVTARGLEAGEVTIRCVAG
jgi:hypothetical protein